MASWSKTPIEPSTEAPAVAAADCQGGKAARIVAGLLALVIVGLAQQLDAHATEPLSPAAACEQATADGYYTAELWAQCLDDYADSQAGA